MEGRKFIYLIITTRPGGWVIGSKVNYLVTATPKGHFVYSIYWFLNRCPPATDHPSATTNPPLQGGYDELNGFSTDDAPAKAGGDNMINELSTIHTTRSGGWC